MQKLPLILMEYTILVEMRWNQRFRNWLSRQTESIYVLVMSRSNLEKANNRVLNLALHARGYQNHGSSRKTGEKKLLRTMKTLKIETALDIGANVGDYSRLLMSDLNAHVIAFEPLDNACMRLSELKELYPDNFEYFQIALSDKDALQEISYSSEPGELGSLVASNMKLDFVANQNTEKKTIKTFKLDSIVEKSPALFSRIDFIKIDVEGHEYSVIHGALETISRFKPKIIQVEFNVYNLFSGISLLKIAELLPNYSLMQILPGSSGLAPRDPKDPLTNICYYSNFVFVLKTINLFA